MKICILVFSSLFFFSSTFPFEGSVFEVEQTRSHPELCVNTKDLDLDRRDELTVWREASGSWLAYLSGTHILFSRQWGLAGDLPLSADFDGDGLKDLTVWRASNGTWYHCLSSTGHDCSKARIRQFGNWGDYPLSGDLDGDGRDDEVVWRPANGVWYYYSSAENKAQSFQWGLPGDIPLLADIDGDGVDDAIAWRPREGTWYALLSSKGRSVSPGDFVVKQFGLPGDHPLSGDFDGDNIDDLVVWRPSSGFWYICESSSNFNCFIGPQQQFGLSTDLPVLGDFDGDQKTDLAVWREGLLPFSSETGRWYWTEASEVGGGRSLQRFSKQWGLPGDVPVKPRHALAHSSTLLGSSAEAPIPLGCPETQRFAGTNFSTSLRIAQLLVLFG